MSIQVTSINDLTPEEVSAQQEALTELLQDKYPDIDLRHGVMRDLVQYVNAIFAAKHVKEIDRYKSAQSLAAIEADPTLADEGVVDSVLSNYNVTRYSGAASKGLVTVEFSADLTVVIPVGTRFTTSAMVYETTSYYTAYKSDMTSTDPSVLILHKMPSGNYGCNIEVTATEIGSAGFIPKGTELDMGNNLVNGVKAYAAEDFSQGSDADTNLTLITKLADGMATPCWGNRYNIAAILRSKSDIHTLVDISVIGMSDPEMHRDMLTIFPVSVGGRADIYVKSSPDTITVDVDINCSFQGMNKGAETWYAYIDRGVLPGAYGVTDIRMKGSNNAYSLVEQTVISTGDSDAFYSAYQALGITFATTDLNNIGIQPGDTRTFTITLKGIPYIKRIQEIFEDDQLMPVCANALVRAAIPAFVDVNVEILKPSGLTPDSNQEVAIKKSIMSYINNLGFAEVVTASQVIAVINDKLLSNQSIYKVSLASEVWGPYGNIYRSASDSVIEAPDDPLNYVSKKTVTFYTDMDRLEISYRNK